jgi:hypothetical protein
MVLLIPNTPIAFPVLREAGALAGRLVAILAGALGLKTILATVMA